jgi:hypothetical protein
MDQQPFVADPCARRTWGVPDPDYPDNTIPANRTFLLDMIADIGTSRFEYVYDLGDRWSQTITIVKPMPAVPGIAYPLLIDAIRRCPPEDQAALRVTWKCWRPYATRPTSAMPRRSSGLVLTSTQTMPIAPSSRRTWPS